MIPIWLPAYGLFISLHSLQYTISIWNLIMAYARTIISRII